MAEDKFSWEAGDVIWSTKDGKPPKKKKKDPVYKAELKKLAQKQKKEVK